MLTLLFGALAILVLVALAMGLAFPKGSNLTATVGLGNVALGSVTGAQVIDPSVANLWSLTATGNITLSSVQGFVPGQYYSLAFTQDATGGRTLAFSGITVLFATAGVITPTAAANAITHYTFIARSATDLYMLAKV